MSGRLFSAFCIIASFRLCYMRFSFKILDRIGLPGKVNLVFIFYCLAMVSGMMIFLKLIERLDARNERNNSVYLFRALCFAAIPFAVLSYFTQHSFSVLFQFATMVLAAGALALCFREISSGAVAPSHIGRYLGCGFAVMALSGALIFNLPSADIPAGIILVILCCALAASALLFRPCTNDQVPAHNEALWMTEPSPPQNMLLGGVAAIVLYSLISGILDNIYFFESTLNAIPNYVLLLMLYNIFNDLLMGYIFDKYKWMVSGAIAFLLIGAGQSMSFFTDKMLLAYPYIALTGIGTIMCEILMVGLPIAYCIRAGKRGIIPGLGYICLYTGFFIMGVVFEFLPDSFYKAALGVVLIFSVAAACLVLSLGMLYERYRFDALLKRTPELGSYKEIFRFTLKECEVAEYLLSGVTTDEIASKMFITSRTVKYHIGQLLMKTESKNRVELVSRLRNLPHSPSSFGSVSAP